eukprot:COSAG02_NODE_13333_length_1408_cov_1.517189_1_plen_171_part_00
MTYNALLRDTKHSPSSEYLHHAAHARLEWHGRAGYLQRANWTSTGPVAKHSVQDVYTCTVVLWCLRAPRGKTIPGRASESSSQGCVFLQWPSHQVSKFWNSNHLDSIEYVLRRNFGSHSRRLDRRIELEKLERYIAPMRTQHRMACPEDICYLSHLRLIGISDGQYRFGA